MNHATSPAYITDSSLDSRNPAVVADLKATTCWVLEKLKETKPGEELKLAELYSAKMPSGEGPADITLYRAFHKLLECGAAEGISPYACDEWGDHIHKDHKTMTISAGPKLGEIKSVCTVAAQNFEMMQIQPGKRPFSEDWALGQRPVFVFLSEHEGETAAEEAFLILNEPGNGRGIGHKGPSLSVGDIVEVEPIGAPGKTGCFLCSNMGWENRPGTLGTAMGQEAKAPKPNQPTPKRNRPEGPEMC